MLYEVITALYNFSGLNSATITQCYKLDLSGGAWTPTVTLPQPRLLASAHVVGDKIYVVGGYSSANPFTTHGQVLEYDPAGNTLTPLSSMNTPVYAAGSFVKDGRIWVLGGGTTSFQAQSDAIQIYDPAIDRWATSNSRLPLAMRSFQAEVIGDDVYLVGGYQYASHRITSYNVCYTKLLRLCAARRSCSTNRFSPAPIEWTR